MLFFKEVRSLNRKHLAVWRTYYVSPPFVSSLLWREEHWGMASTWSRGLPYLWRPHSCLCWERTVSGGRNTEVLMFNAPEGTFGRKGHLSLEVTLSLQPWEPVVQEWTFPFHFYLLWLWQHILILPNLLVFLFLQGSAGMCKQHFKCNAYPLAFSLCELLELKGKESLFIPCHLTHWPFHNCSSSQTWNTLLGHCLMLPSLRPSQDCSLAEGLLLCP